MIPVKLNNITIAEMEAGQSVACLQQVVAQKLVSRGGVSTNGEGF